VKAGDELGGRAGFGKIVSAQEAWCGGVGNDARRRGNVLRVNIFAPELKDSRRQHGCSNYTH
jgi:hypothetical protein